MPWSGGTFVRDYNWQDDRDNGIKIRADRMDGEFDNYAAGMELLLLRNGGNSPTAHIPWGGFKITGLAAGTAATDAVNLSQLTGSQWIAETAVITWLSATTFSVAGDVSATYSVGRRLKIVHNTGGTTVYATVTAVAFSVVTTVTVETDNATALVSTITAVSYGLLTFANSAYFAPRTHFLAYMDAGTSPYTAGVTTLVPIDTAAYDSRVEWERNASGTFTPYNSGFYQFDSNISIVAPVGGLLTVILNVSPGATVRRTQLIAGDAGLQSVAFGALVYLDQNSDVSLYISFTQNATFQGYTTSFYNTFISLSRLP